MKLPKRVEFDWLLRKFIHERKSYNTRQIQNNGKAVGLEESVTFDDIQRRFRFIVCLVMKGKVNDVVIVFRGFLPPTKARIRCSTLAISQRHSSLLFEIQVESTVLLA